jgi:stage II sporulation protein GA (sporulation sigma-E factor processing peptidase)
MVIYIDVLITVNVYVTFFLVQSAAAFTHTKIKKIRLVAACLWGGICSLVILLPPMFPIVTAFTKTISGFITVLIAFYHKDCKIFRITLYFFVVSTVFAGITLALQMFFSPLNMTGNNGYVYFDISFGVLVITTIAAYFTIKALRYLLDVKFGGEKIYNINVTSGKKHVKLTGFADTGNTMTDFFTGLPVIICSKKAVNDLFPETPYETAMPGIRLLPFVTVNSSGIMPVIKPEEVYIGEKKVSALVGLASKEINGADAVFTPKLLL